jgi:hypothetical protein
MHTVLDPQHQLPHPTLDAHAKPYWLEQLAEAAVHSRKERDFFSYAHRYQAVLSPLISVIPQTRGHVIPRSSTTVPLAAAR